MLLVNCLCETVWPIYVTVVSDFIGGFSYLHLAPSKLLYLTKELSVPVLATLLEGAALAFDISSVKNFKNHYQNQKVMSPYNWVISPFWLSLRWLTNNNKKLSMPKSVLLYDVGKPHSKESLKFQTVLYPVLVIKFHPFSWSNRTRSWKKGVKNYKCEFGI